MPASSSAPSASAATARAALRDYIFILTGMALYAVGFTVFILPHGIVTGGMAGFSTLVYFATGTRVPVGFTMLAANIALLAVGYRVLGRTFIIRTIFGAALLSLLIGSIEGFFTSRPPIVTDMTMSVVMGAVICGMGIGVYYSHRGTAGGTDTVAAIMEKVSDISVGRTMMVIDVAVVTASFFLPFDGDLDARVQARVQTILYGWASIVIYSFITDRWVGAGRQTLQFLILSDRWERIAERITHETGRGVTTFDGHGYWTGSGRTMLVVWCRRYDAERIYVIVHSVDPGAYIIQSEARSVHGNGFDALRIKSRHP